MKLKLIYIIVFLTAFLFGSLFFTNFFKSKILSQTKKNVKAEVSKASKNKIPTCLKKINLNLGDNFVFVDKFLSLNKDPNGENGNIEWEHGKLTDYFSIFQPQFDHQFEDGDKLNSSIFVVFDENQQLTSLTINWIYDGENNRRNHFKTIKYLLIDQVHCFNLEDFDLNKLKDKRTISSNLYESSFEYNFSDFSSFGKASYTIKYK